MPKLLPLLLTLALVVTQGVWLGHPLHHEGDAPGAACHLCLAAAPLASAVAERGWQGPVAAVAWPDYWPPDPPAIAGAAIAPRSRAPPTLPL